MGCAMPEIKDGNWTLFAYDQETGRTIWSTWIDGKITFRIDTPVDHIIHANMIDRTSDHPDRFGDYVRIASIPLQHFYDVGLAEASVQQDNKFISRFINDSDNAAWRTREGRF